MIGAEPRAGVTATPSLRRRLACLLYEGVLLFGVLMATGLVYAAVTGQTHALRGMRGLQVTIFVVLGLYFVAFWTRRGQTLAMQTWHIRLVTVGGQPLSVARACARYLLSWLWFIPALGTLHVAGMSAGAPALATLAAGVVTYALLAGLHPSRQFLHDVICATRLITWLPEQPPMR